MRPAKRIIGGTNQLVVWKCINKPLKTNAGGTVIFEAIKSIGRPEQ
jgi:hypothetical protein